AAREDLLRALGDIGLNAAPRDGADVTAALGHQVLRTGLARRRADRADDRRDGGLFAALGGCLDRVEDRALHVDQDTAATATDGSTNWATWYVATCCRCSCKV